MRSRLLFSNLWTIGSKEDGMKLPKKAREAWDNAMIVRGRHPNVYRRDQLGDIVFHNSYGKKTPMGWRVINGGVFAIRGQR